MAYNPKDYKELFPKGFFEYEDKPITSWADSHRLFALNQTALKDGEKTLAPGFVLKQGHIKQGNGFSNYKIFEIDPNLRKMNIEFFGDEMFYPLEAFEKLDNPLLLTNAGYFYLTDDEEHDPVAPPKVRTGNMLINNGELVNLPILNRSSIVISMSGEVNMYFLKATGKLLANRKEYRWVGSKSETYKDAFIIYDSSNIEIPLVNDPIMGPSRKAKETFVSAGAGRMLAICERKNGKFLITQISSSPILINDKEMVVAIPEHIKVSMGDNLEFTTIDTLKISDVETAVSTGPMLFHSYDETIEQAKKEFSVSDMANPNNPHEETKNLARGCLVKLRDGRLCSVIVDGIPQAGNIYPGVTLKEFIDFINEKYPDFESAIATDPSSSVKAIYLEAGKTMVFGNLHYLAHKKDESGNIKFWPNGKLGRKLNSALVVY